MRLVGSVLACAFAASLSFATFSSTAEAQTGMASYYKHGRKTANGERFRPGGYTAAHRSLKFGTKVRVTNMRNGRSVVVRINDRGPFIRGRIIDLAYGAARAVGLHRSGVSRVSLKVLN